MQAENYCGESDESFRIPYRGGSLTLGEVKRIAAKATSRRYEDPYQIPEIYAAVRNAFIGVKISNTSPYWDAFVQALDCMTVLSDPLVVSENKVEKFLSEHCTQGGFVGVPIGKVPSGRSPTTHKGPTSAQVYRMKLTRKGAKP